MLELDAGQQRRVRLSGDVAWQDSLAANAELAWRDFQRRLYPEIEEPPVTLRELNAQVSTITVTTSATSTRLSPDRPAISRWRVRSAALEAVHLPQLSLRAERAAPAVR